MNADKKDHPSPDFQRWAQQAADRLVAAGELPEEPPEDWDYTDPETPEEVVEGVPVDVWMRLGVRGL